MALLVDGIVKLQIGPFKFADAKNCDFSVESQEVDVTTMQSGNIMPRKLEGVRTLSLHISKASTTDSRVYDCSMRVEFMGDPPARMYTDVIPNTGKPGGNCQLLVGSYEGAKNVCNCPSADKCKLSKAFRDKHFDHPDFVAKREYNLKKYLKTLPKHEPQEPKIIGKKVTAKILDDLIMPGLIWIKPKDPDKENYEFILPKDAFKILQPRNIIPPGSA